MADNTNSTNTTEGSESSSTVISVKETKILPMDISAITEGTIEGKGVFDAMMRGVFSQLADQWDSGKITGQEFATVYTAAITATLAQSVEYVRAQARFAYEIQSLENDAELKKAQIRQIDAETALLGVRNQKETAELAKTPIELELLRKQSLRADTENDLVAKQVEQLAGQITKLPYEIQILEHQVLGAEAQVANTTASTERIVQETTLKLPLEVAILDKEKESMDYKNTLVDAQAKLAVQQLELAPVELELRRAQLQQAVKQAQLMEREYDIKVGELALQTKQIDMMGLQIEVQREELKVKMAQVIAQEAQAELYRQKVVSEIAQTDPSVILPGSVIALNNDVLKGQVSAFKFDKLNRAAKLHLDVFSTTYSIGDRTVNNQNKLTDLDIGVIMTSMITEATTNN